MASETATGVAATERLVLYLYASCPFCARVQRFLDERGVALPSRDILREPAAMRELVQGGGRPTVPCLRIESQGEVRWLYESADIIDYLAERTGHADCEGQMPRSAT